MFEEQDSRLWGVNTDPRIERNANASHFPSVQWILI